jgi:ribosomal protein L27
VETDTDYTLFLEDEGSVKFKKFENGTIALDPELVPLYRLQ